jgi:hypothetical protein
MKQVFARLKALFSSGPPLATLGKTYDGATIEAALTTFEEACCEENFQGIRILETTARHGGWRVRYEVRWKYSVLDDGAPATHESSAWLIRSGAGYRVRKATRERHSAETFLD